jgi:hypothetical protein
MLVTALGVYFVVTRSWWLGGDLLVLAFAMERLGAALYSKLPRDNVQHNQDTPLNRSGFSGDLRV